MATDRELLELAAKAAGYEPQGMEDGKLYLFGVQDGWNPLTDDGDALRLAVALKITVYHQGDEHFAEYEDDYHDMLVTMVEHDKEGGPLAATRRVIVGAAAEIQISRDLAAAEPTAPINP